MTISVSVSFWFTPSLFFVNANNYAPASVTRHALVVFLVVPNFDYISLRVIKLEMSFNLIVFIVKRKSQEELIISEILSELKMKIEICIKI